MWNILRFVKEKLVWVLPAAMASGLLLGSVLEVGFLKQAVLPLTMLMVLPMMVNLEWRTLASLDGASVFLVTLAFNFLVVPVLAYVIGRLAFPDDPAAVTGMVLIGVLPTSGMTLSWTGFAKGNVRAALRNVLASLLLGALLLPVYLRLFLGKASGIPVVSIVRQVALVILVPLVIGGFLGHFLRRRLGPDAYRKTVKPKMPLISSAAVVLMVASAMALKAGAILSAPQAIWKVLPALLGFYGIIFLLGHWIGRRFLEPGDAVALVFSTAMRNLSIALALSLVLLGKGSGTASLLSSLAFLIQVQAAAWYVKLAGRSRFTDVPARQNG